MKNTTNVTVSVYNVQTIIDNLQAAFNVCQQVDYSQTDDHEKSAPYAVGYSRGAIKLVIDQLETYLASVPVDKVA
jgi:hypothetical protein